MGVSGYEGLQPQNPYNLKAEKGISEFDRPQMLIINYVYELPFARSYKGVAGALAKGWETTGIAIFESGLPVDPGISTLTSGLATRPDAVKGQGTSGPKTVAEWFNTGAFTDPPFGYNGNASVNSIRGRGMYDWQMGFFKNFTIREDVKLQFRVETFNTWNHPSFNSVDATYGTGGFGQVTSVHTHPRGRACFEAEFLNDGSICGARSARAPHFSLLPPEKRLRRGEGADAGCEYSQATHTSL